MRANPPLKMLLYKFGMNDGNCFLKNTSESSSNNSIPIHYGAVENISQFLLQLQIP